MKTENTPRDPNRTRYFLQWDVDKKTYIASCNKFPLTMSHQSGFTALAKLEEIINEKLAAGEVGVMMPPPFEEKVIIEVSKKELASLARATTEIFDELAAENKNQEVIDLADRLRVWLGQYLVD